MCNHDGARLVWSLIPGLDVPESPSVKVEIEAAGVLGYINLEQALAKVESRLTIPAHPLSAFGLQVYLSARQVKALVCKGSFGCVPVPIALVLRHAYTDQGQDNRIHLLVERGDEVFVLALVNDGIKLTLFLEEPDTQYGPGEVFAFVALDPPV